MGHANDILSRKRTNIQGELLFLRRSLESLHIFCRKSIVSFISISIFFMFVHIRLSLLEKEQERERERERFVLKLCEILDYRRAPILALF